MIKKIWLHDKLVDPKDATVSVFDHGLLYGDGVFEGIRVYNGKIFQHDEHLKRLYDSAKAIRLDIGMPFDELKKNVELTVETNEVVDGYIRLIITRGVGDLGLNPFVCEKPGIIIIADNVALYPAEMYETGLKVISSSVIRNNPQALPAQIKSLNYLNNILAVIEAKDANAGEAIMFNQQGYVAEASGDNLFIFKKGKIYTPPISAGSLDGITRAVVIELAKQNGFEVIEQNLTRVDLYTSDEVFLTGTAAEVIGIVEIDGRIIGDGKPGTVTRTLKEKFFEYARS